MLKMYFKNLAVISVRSFFNIMQELVKLTFTSGSTVTKTFMKWYFSFIDVCNISLTGTVWSTD